MKLSRKAIFLTNFDRVDLPIYKEAVKTFPKKQFKIANRHCLFENKIVKSKTILGLYLNVGQEIDCGAFWMHFDEVAKRMGGTAVQKKLTKLGVS